MARFAAGCLLLLALAGCAGSAGCALVQVARVPLEPRARLFAVPVTLNGRNASLLLDTGAQMSVVTEAAAKRFDLVRDARFYTIISGMA